jgi:hypothetical protein
MRPWIRQAVFAAAAAALIAPSARWILDAWGSSPQDSPGPWFAGLALAWWVVVALLVRPAVQRFDLSALPLLVLWGLIGAAGILFDVRLLVAAAGIGTAWALAWGIQGATSGLLLIPSLAAALLALPTTGYLIDELWLSLGLVSPGDLMVKTAICVLLMLAGAAGLLLHLRGLGLQPGTAATTYAVLGLIATAGLFMAFRPPQFGPSVRLDEGQWAFSGWLGAEIAATPAEQRLFGRSRLSKRAYARPDGRRVAVLIVESEDVHRLHAPEYCLTGSGWRMRDRAPSPWSVGNPAAAAAGLAASRGTDELKSVYWFTSDSRSTSDLTGLRLQSRIAPNEPFTLYMVTAIDETGEGSDEILSDFLEDAPWQTP